MKKQETEELWRLCFGDKEAFIRLFFDEVYRDENTLVIEKQGTVVAALQCIPYSLWMQGKEIPMAYICGVSTHPNERGNGFMGRLMRKADEELKRRKIPLATLIPAESWLADIYRKYGYSYAFYYDSKTYIRSSSTLSSIGDGEGIIASEITPQLFNYFDRKLRKRVTCVLHSASDFRVIYKDLTLYGGKLLWLKNTKQKVEGMAFAIPEESSDTIFMPELLYDNESAKERLLAFAASTFNIKKINIKNPPASATPISGGMAKLIDPDYFRKAKIDIRNLFSEKLGYMTLMLD
ncbi:MAG: GNAT family N-acetyltransferase [Massilibacteroides sp.]|nr:GNAT family N-acetyltransferase [Massilibacteroides sp.]